MKTIKISFLFLVAIVLLPGFVVEGSAAIYGCPESLYDQEIGCQIPYDFEYVPVGEEQVEVASVTGCPANLYDPEQGCQLPVEFEYVEEYELVKEEVSEKTVMGCPEDFYEPELGCQLFHQELTPGATY